VLAGTDTSCKFAAPWALGANGLLTDGAALYVANTNLGQIAKIPILADGEPGLPDVIAGPDCSALGGVDGLAFDGEGGILAVLNSQNKLLRVGVDGKVTELFAGAPLDNPASVAVATIGSTKSVFVTNSALSSQNPLPGLLSMPLP